jgi:hypothetical protein
VCPRSLSECNNHRPVTRAAIATPK